MHADALRWFERRTSHASDWPTSQLVRAKGDATVSVVLPALNEERTVGDVVSVFRRLAEQTGLVDEIVVMDSGSSDGTRAAATAAGAVVHHRDEVLAAHGSLPGKGEVLWKSLAVTIGSIVVFCDSDLEDVGPDYVTGLLGPLMLDAETAFVKACYDRPLRTAAGSGVGSTSDSFGETGGRVTELVARPLLNQYFPALSGVVQPLGGEYAARRELLERLPFTSGYGVDVGLLIDTLRSVGLSGMAQVDLDTRIHRHQPQRALGQMAAQVMQAILRRVPQAHPSFGEITQFHRDDGRFVPESTSVSVTDRPPIATLPAGAPSRGEGRVGT